MSEKEIKKAKRFISIALGIVIVFAILTILLLSHLGVFSEKNSLKITIPAGRTDIYVYAAEEISPRHGKLTITAGDGMGDATVILRPAGTTDVSDCSLDYITPGLEVEVDVEKGKWYWIGVDVENPTDEDIVVYLNVYDVDVRIA